MPDELAAVKRMQVLQRAEGAQPLGEISLLRLRAEILLEYAVEFGEIVMTDHELEELERIAVAPKLDDKEFLATFDDRWDAAMKRP